MHSAIRLAINLDIISERLSWTGQALNTGIFGCDVFVSGDASKIVGCLLRT